MARQQSRHWVGTTFAKEFVPESIPEVEGAAYQKEVCPESGKEHYQFYIYLKKKTTLTKLKSFFPGAHLERARDIAKSIAYCNKEETRLAGFIPIAYGLPALQSLGTMGDGTTILNCLKTKSAIDCIQQHPKWARSYNTLVKIHVALMPKRSFMTKGYLLSGPTGVGKSHRAHQYTPNATVSGDLKWFDAYTGEETMIVEEIEYFPITMILQLVDQYPYLLPIKGGHQQMMAKRVIFTSNRTLEDLLNCHQNENQKEAIRRRIKEFIISDKHQLINIE